MYRFIRGCTKLRPNYSPCLYYISIQCLSRQYMAFCVVFFTNAWLQRYSHHYQMTQSTNNWIVTLKLRKYPHLCDATCYRKQTPDSKVHRADMGPTWVLSAHAGPINLVIREQHSKPWSCVVYSTCTDCFVRVGNVCLSLWFIVI